MKPCVFNVDFCLIFILTWNLLEKKRSLIGFSLPVSVNNQKRGNILELGVKTDAACFLFSCFLFLSFMPLSLSPDVFQSSVCQQWPASTPSKGSDFKIEHPFSATLGVQTCCLEFVSLG